MTDCYQFKVSINFPGYMYVRDIEFLSACNVLEGHIDAEANALSRQLNVINKDQRFVSWISEKLGGVHPPSFSTYLVALGQIKAARNSYKMSNFKTAEKILFDGVKTFNGVHKQWIEYRNGIIGGAEIAITTCEVAIKVTQVYVAVATGGGSLIVSSGIVAGVSGLTEITKKGSMAYLWKINSSLTINDFIDIGGTIVEEFATSLLGGQLGKFFLGKFVPKYSAIAKIDPQAAKEAFKKGILPDKAFTYCKRGIADFSATMTSNAIVKPLIWIITQSASSNSGKKMSVDTFIDDVITKLITDRYDTAANIFFLWIKKK